LELVPPHDRLAGYVGSVSQRIGAFTKHGLILSGIGGFVVAVCIV
jgi:hypothetical protein